MADNYLEKRMEDLRSGRLTETPRRRKTPAATVKSIQKPQKPLGLAAVINSCPADGLAFLQKILKSVKEAGYSVAFGGVGSRHGTALAQQTGSQFYPTDADPAEDPADILDKVLEIRKEMPCMIIAVSDTYDSRFHNNIIQWTECHRETAEEEGNPQPIFVCVCRKPMK